MSTALQTIAGMYPTSHSTVFAAIRPAKYSQDGVQSHIALYTGNRSEGTLARTLLTLNEVLGLHGFAATQPMSAPVSQTTGQAYSRHTLGAVGQNYEQALKYQREELAKDPKNLVNGSLSPEAQDRAEDWARQASRGMGTGIALRCDLELPRPFRLITSDEAGNEVVGDALDLKIVEVIHFQLHAALQLRYVQALTAAGKDYSAATEGKGIRVLNRTPFQMMVQRPLKQIHENDPLAAYAWSVAYPWTYSHTTGEIESFRAQNVQQITAPSDHWQALVHGIALVALDRDEANPRGVQKRAMAPETLCRKIWGSQFEYVAHPIPTEPVIIRGDIKNVGLGDLATFAI